MPSGLRRSPGEPAERSTGGLNGPVIELKVGKPFGLLHPGVDIYASGMTSGDASGAALGEKDGLQWRIGTDAEVSWVVEGTVIGRAITSAIPPVFEAYATIVVPDERDECDEQLLDLLDELSGDKPWWLGYLDTGSDDVVFPDAPRVTLYAGWNYVLVQAGPEQAANWRPLDESWSAREVLPDIIFPSDRSWLLSRLWDDDWRCFGGSFSAVDRLLGEDGLDTRRVGRDQDDATPPGHTAF
jgi:hypothetical protein